MIIGIPKEIKNNEYRVGLVPGSIRELIKHGHQVIVEHNAGLGIGFDDAAYAAMETLLESAQTSIRLTFYLFGGPDADRMAEIMAAKQGAGADVRVLLDRSLGFGPTLPQVLWECRRTYQKLMRLGINTRLSDRRPLPESLGKAALSHHKYIVTDEQEALAGGMNVGTVFRRYHDLMLSLTGPIAADLAQQFDVDWDTAGGVALPPQAPDFDTLVPFAGGLPGSARVVGTRIGRRTTKAALIQHLRRADTSVCVALCEMGRTALLGELIACHRRGVKVRVLLDPQIMASFGPSGLLNAGATQTLLDAGIAVRLYRLGPDFVRLHLKMAIFDGASAVAGSTNWTRGGFEWVGETDIELHGGSVIAELTAQFEADWQRSPPAPLPTQSAHFLHDWYEKWAQ